MNVRLNGNQLKLIAVITMLIDHAAVAFWTTSNSFYWFMRGIGRIAFPIYAFLLVEGFYHTRSLKKYAMRLLVLAVISEIPFDYLAYGRLMDFQGQNVFWTLLLGLLMLRCQQLLWTRCSDAAGRQMQLFTMVLCCGIAWLFRTDYDYRGILLIGLFGWFYGELNRQVVFGLIWMTLTLGLMRLPLIVGYAAAFFLIQHYDGTRGAWNVKAFFYAFYPVHLIILDVLKILLWVFR